ncbi:hypothetical protein K491DRAFT_78424 [Lophiostoma macrostomum CBS 122681]|uniref:Uncharacterized protein n=1 Tax=Lophiostoma macrostomum CBS 122681 TaxID=1314788 RepID=A0A6A6TJV7_9PLEO|nr:hypothetical protein K491DRAFT_78424 [Lophiostoma macrostomum CBS 122681]
MCQRRPYICPSFVYVWWSWRTREVVRRGSRPMCDLAQHDVQAAQTVTRAMLENRRPWRGKTRPETRQYGSGTNLTPGLPGYGPIAEPRGGGEGLYFGLEASKGPEEVQPSVLSNQDTLLTSSHAEASEIWCCSCCRNQPMSERFALVAARIIVARSLAASQVAAGDQGVLVQVRSRTGLARPRACDKSRQKKMDSAIQSMNDCYLPKARLCRNVNILGARLESSSISKQEEHSILESRSCRWWRCDSQDRIGVGVHSHSDRRPFQYGRLFLTPYPVGLPVPVEAASHVMPSAPCANPCEDAGRRLRSLPGRCHCDPQGTAGSKVEGP